MKKNDLESSALELSDFLWRPLDNEDFKSLDQLTVFIDMGNGNQRIHITTVDIIALIKKIPLLMIIPSSTMPQSTPMQPLMATTKKGTYARNNSKHPVYHCFSTLSL
jgi:hypothetical protein